MSKFEKLFGDYQLPHDWATEPRLLILLQAWTDESHDTDNLSRAELILLHACTHHRQSALIRTLDTGERPADCAKQIDYIQWVVRAKLLRFLCTNATARTVMNSNGIILDGAVIAEFPNLRSHALPPQPPSDKLKELDLAHIEIPFPIELRNCFVPAGIRLTSSTCKSVLLTGTDCGPIQAAGVRIQGSLFLQDEIESDDENAIISRTRVMGGINLYGARISRDLSAANALIASRHSLEHESYEFLNKAREQRQPSSEVPRPSIGVPWPDALTFWHSRSNKTRILRSAPSASPRLRPKHAINADDLVVNNVYLRKGFCAFGAVRLSSARVRNELVLVNAAVIALKSDAIDARGCRVGGDVILCCGFRSVGQIDFSMARVGGNFILGDGVFCAIDGMRDAKGELPSERATAGETRGCSVVGDNIRIRGNLDVRGALHLSRQYQPYVAGLAALGDMNQRLAWAASGAASKCREVLELNASEFQGANREMLKEALNQQKNAAVFCGGISFAGARVQGQVDLLGAWVDSAYSDFAVRLSRASIAGRLCANAMYYGAEDSPPFLPNGPLELSHATVGQYLDSFLAWPLPGCLRIDGFTYHRIEADGPEELIRVVDREVARHSAPSGSSTEIDNPTAVATPQTESVKPETDPREPLRVMSRLPSRIRWLARRTKGKSMVWGQHDPQPYSHLVLALRRNGSEREAREVLAEHRHRMFKHELEELLTRQRALGGFAASAVDGIRTWIQILYHATVQRALAVLTRHWTTSAWAAIAWLILVLVGMCVFSWAKHTDHGSFSPTQAVVYVGATAAPGHNGHWPAHYPEFNPLWYSIDAALPIIGLHQEAFWSPSTESSSKVLIDLGFQPLPLGVFGQIGSKIMIGDVAEWYLWVHIVIGWLLTTIVVIGFTGHMHHHSKGHEE